MKKKNKKNRVRKTKNNIFFRMTAIISTIIFVIFGIMLYMLDMIPFKYLIIFYIVFILLYVYLLLTSLLKNIKNKIRISSFIFLLLFGTIFGFGIKYLNDTMDFVGIISKDLLQKEVYYLMSLEESKYEDVKDLDGSSIGIYSSKNSDDAVKLLDKKINTTIKEYKNVVELFEDLQDKKIDGILVNESTKNLLNTDLSDMNIKLREIYKVYVSIEKTDIVKVVDVTKKPFNIYIAGGDAYGSIDNVTNTDVNMVATIDPVNRKILLTSIPRDYYVNLPSFGDDAYDKLTHAGYYGIEESAKAIENLLDIDINYYVKVNFSTIEGVIDAIGGVDVYVDKGFTASDGSYTFVTGYNHMNGKKALRFARERKSFSNGDVQRVKNQQKVLTAIINKVTSSTTLVTNFSQILDSVGNSFSTNMETKSINRFIKMQLNNMQGWNIESQNLIGTDLYTKNTYTYPNLELYVMKQDEESVGAAKEKIKKYTLK